MRETQTIPVVFTTVSDPIGAGFVQTLTRPGGNATGFVNIEGSLGGKWVEVLKEVAPGISRAAMMFNPKTSPQTGYYRESLEAAASSLAVEILRSPVGDRDEIQKVMTGLGQESECGPNRCSRRFHCCTSPARFDYNVGGPPSYSSRLFYSTICKGGRPHLLWRGSPRLAAPRSDLRRPNFERCKTARLASPIADQV